MKARVEQFKPRKSVYDYALQPGEFICCRKNVIFKLYDAVLRSTDAGATWAQVLTSTTAEYGAISKDLQKVIIMDATNLYRSVDGGATFSTTTLASIGITHTPYYKGIEFGNGASNGDTIIFGEYGGTNGDYRLWRSADAGATWAIVMTKSAPSVVRHIHTVNYNAFDGFWYATSGDSNVQVHWWKSEDDGVTWTELYDGSTDALNAQRFRNIGMVFTEDLKAIWVTDDYQGSGSAIYSAALSDIKGTLTKLADMPGVGYGIAMNGNNLVAISISNLHNMDKTGYVVVSQDSGKTWTVDGKWALAPSKDAGGFHRILGPTSKGDFLLYQADVVSVLNATRATIMTHV